MSRRIGNLAIGCVEPPLICFECGKVAETRPYGPNGEEICVQCAEKDPFETTVQMLVRLFGETREDAERRALRKGLKPLSSE